MIQQPLVDVIQPTCPECGLSTAGRKVACACGWRLPTGLIVPYTTVWDWDRAFVDLARQHRYLRIMGKFAGKDLSRICELDHAEYLYLSRYPKFSLALLRGFSNLRFLELDYCSIETLDEAEQLPRLQSLALTECRNLVDISSLESCTEIRVLSIALCNKVTNLAPLAALNQLLHFQYEGRRVQSLQPLMCARRLRFLTVNAKVDDGSLSALGELEKLERLYIRKRAFPSSEINRFSALRPDCAVNFV